MEARLGNGPLERRTPGFESCSGTIDESVSKPWPEIEYPFAKQEPWTLLDGVGGRLGMRVDYK